MHLGTDILIKPVSFESHCHNWHHSGNQATLSNQGWTFIG